jgi:hypothetical protein
MKSQWVEFCKCNGSSRVVRVVSRSFLRVTCILAVALLGNASAQTFTSHYSFGAVPADGVAPSSGVILEKACNLFRTTGWGGSKVPMVISLEPERSFK